MARANRHYIPGHIWHITHRCHKQEHLLKFASDRSRFVFWLREARKRYGLQTLNYAVTCNHVHLLVKDGDNPECIPSAMRLIAGRTAQEYNQRKSRKGAFWEDRYHATAVECGEHFLRCLVYIDLNMVRAGVVSHPEDWRHGGYHEIQGNRRRNLLLDLDALAEASEIDCRSKLKTVHREWVQEALRSNGLQRNEAWTNGIAVGSGDFISKTKALLGYRGRARAAVEVDGNFVLREAQENYSDDFSPENWPIALDNAFFWG